MKLTHHVFILGVAFLLFAPAIIFGPSGIDLPTQSLWVQNFTRQLYAGEFYPRWLMDMTAGHGSPVFFYYPPLAYYFTAIFGFLPELGDFDYIQITISACVAVYLSGYAFYYWMRSEGVQDRPAILGALLYMSAPVGICSNFYHLMLFSSLWAYVWIPLIMMCSRMMIKNISFAIPGYAFAFGCLLLTNIPTSMIAALMVFILVAMSVKPGNAVRLLAYFSTGSLLAAGLAGIYLIPAYCFQNFVNINLHWVQFVHWAHYESTRLSMLFWVYYAVLAIGLFIYQRYNMDAAKSAVTLGVVGLLLLLPLNDWVWMNIPLFVYIQISDRLFLIPAVALAWLAATASPRLRPLSYALTAASVVAAFGVSYINHYSEADYTRDEPVKEQMYRLNIDNYGTYLPGKDAFKFFGSPKNIQALSESDPPITFLSGDAEIKIISWEPERILFFYRATVPSVIMVRRLFFPGLIAYGAGDALTLQRDDIAGRVKLALPPGLHEITLERWELVPETLGEKTSFFTLCIIALPVLLRMRHLKRKRRREAREAAAHSFSI